MLSAHNNNDNNNHNNNDNKCRVFCRVNGSAAGQSCHAGIYAGVPQICGSYGVQHLKPKQRQFNWCKTHQKHGSSYTALQQFNGSDKLPRFLPR